MYTHPGKKLLFMGDEFGAWREWDHNDSLEWDLIKQPVHGGLLQFVTDLNGLYQRSAALYELDFEPGGFTWIDCNDFESSVISFIRRAKDPNDFLVVVLSWTPVVRRDYRVGVPVDGFYEEVLNSDAELYGGSNVGNSGGLASEPVEAHGYAQSLNLMIPPLGALVFRRRA
jgi:1,4-alpha-glucan branching enzyme